MAEAVVLLTMSSMARIFLSFPRSLMETAAEAAWLSALSGLALALFQVYILHLLLRPHPGKNIVDVTRDTLGAIAGTAFNLVLTSFFIVVAAIFTREFSETLLLSALPRTPISVVSVGYVSVALMGAYVGIEATARATRVTYPFVVGGIAFLLLSLMPRWDFTKLYPLLGNGPVEVLVKGGVLSGGLSELVIAAVIVKHFKDPGMFGKITARAMVMGFSYLALLELVLAMTILYNVAQELTLPFYKLSTLIYLGRYFQRVEAIFIIIWGYIGMVKVVLTLYGAAVTLAGTLRLPDYRPLLWPLALVIFVSSLMPKDLPSTLVLEIQLRHFAWLPSLGIPLIVLAAGWIKKKRGKKNDSG